MAENDAAAARDQAQAEVARIRDRNRRLIAEQRGEVLSSGLQLNGTVDDVVYDTSLQGELEALSTRYAGQVRSNAYRSEAGLSRRRAANAKSGLGLSILGTSLGAAGRMSTAYSTYKKP